MYIWELAAINEIKFVLVDSDGNEVTGLGDTFDIELSKAGQSTFTPGEGTKNEIGDGWYSYTATLSESNTPGIVAIKVTGVGVVQQNLLAEVSLVADDTPDVNPVAAGCGCSSTNPYLYSNAPSVIFVP